MSVTVVSERKSLVGEGPHWVADKRRLLHVDVGGNALCRLDPETKQTDVLNFEDNFSFVIPYEKDPEKFVVSVGQEVRALDKWGIASHKLAITEKGASPTRLNDGKCDAVGRLWTGTMAIESTTPEDIEPEQGALYSLGCGRPLTKHLNKISISNGITWTMDNQIMFYVDSYVRCVYAFDFDLRNGSVANMRTVVDFNKTAGYKNFGYPDGMTTDTNDKIWLACYDGGQVIKIDPETGNLLQTIKFPASKITSCCFGGINDDELYVTSACHRLTPEELKQQPDAGKVFVVKELGSKGKNANSFTE